MAFNEFLISKRERMSWVAEATFGAGGTMSSGEIVGYDCAIDAADWNLGFQEILTAGADDLNVQSLVTGPKSLPYTMTFTPANFRWLKYFMAVADADDSGTKTHTFTQRNTILSWDLEWAKRHTTNHVITTVGNFAKKATMSFAKASGPGNEGFLKVAMDCVAQDQSQGSSVTSLSNLTRTPARFNMVKVTIDGTEYKEVNSGEMAIDLGITESDSRYCSTTNGALIGEPIPGVFRITGRYNINLKDKTLYDAWAAGTAISGACTLLVDIDGTGNNQLLATFSNFFIHNAIASTNEDGKVISVDVIWSALSFGSCVSRDNITSY